MITSKTGTDGAESIFLTGRTPAPSSALAGTSSAFIWPPRTRKLIKSRAAFLSASFLFVEFPAPTYGNSVTRSSQRKRCRCFGP